jgi:hypothetical protein
MRGQQHIKGGKGVKYVQLLDVLDCMMWQVESDSSSYSKHAEPHDTELIAIIIAVCIWPLDAKAVSSNLVSHTLGCSSGAIPPCPAPGL